MIKQVSPLNGGAATQTAVAVTCRVNAKPRRQAASAEHAVCFVVYITSGDGNITTGGKKQQTNKKKPQKTKNKKQTQPRLKHG